MRCLPIRLQDLPLKLIIEDLSGIAKVIGEPDKHGITVALDKLDKQRKVQEER